MALRAAGGRCALVRDPRHLPTRSASTPSTTTSAATATTRRELLRARTQNSRGFRALEVWLGLRQAGRAGVAQLIRDDIALARMLFDAAPRTRLEARTRQLSIATFRYVPRDLARAPTARLPRPAEPRAPRPAPGGRRGVRVNAIVNGDYPLRACIVNFRTTAADVDALVEIVARIDGEIDAELWGEG